ncbi:MAG: hypothetical protein WBB07_17850, partial [Mycobacterium sp.]
SPSDSPIGSSVRSPNHPTACKTPRYRQASRSKICSGTGYASPDADRTASSCLTLHKQGPDGMSKITDTRTPGQRLHHTPDWNAGAPTTADQLHFSCGPHHRGATNGSYHTEITETGRLAWADNTEAPRTNQFHHPEELLSNHDEDDP